MAATPNNEPPLIQPMSLMPPPPVPQQPQTSVRAEDATGSSRMARTETQGRSETPARPDAQNKPAVPEKDPMRDLLDRVDRLAPMIASTEPVLAKTLNNLSQRGADPELRAQSGFRHEVAYALQDLEKTPLGRLELAPAIRAEMTQLASTAPGLTNERVQALMGATGTVQDRNLVADIRSLGREVGRRVEQNIPEIESRTDALESRSRLTPRASEPEASVRSPEARGPDADSRRVNGASSGARDGHDGINGFANRTRFNESTAQNANSQGQVTVQHSVLDTLLRAMRPDGNQPQPPWEPPATSVADRLAASERRAQTISDNRTLASAEQRGRVALDALQGFTNTEGAAVMGKIQAAAKTEPGGLPQVLSEMRDGGRFADLRKQFGNALSDDAGFAAAYDKAAGALAAYGKSRTEIDPILARRPDVTAFTQRLTEMDSEIGKAAAATPSKTEGRSMMEDLAKQAGELLQRAVDSVRAAFSRAPTAGASSSPSPGP